MQIITRRPTCCLIAAPEHLAGMPGAADRNPGAASRASAGRRRSGPWTAKADASLTHAGTERSNSCSQETVIESRGTDGTLTITVYPLSLCDFHHSLTWSSKTARSRCRRTGSRHRARCGRRAPPTAAAPGWPACWGLPPRQHPVWGFQIMCRTMLRGPLCAAHGSRPRMTCVGTALAAQALCRHFVIVITISHWFSSRQAAAERCPGSRPRVARVLGPPSPLTHCAIKRLKGNGTSCLPSDC